MGNYVSKVEADEEKIEDHTPPLQNWKVTGMVAVGYFFIRQGIRAQLLKYDFFKAMDTPRRERFEQYCLSSINTTYSAAWSVWRLSQMMMPDYQTKKIPSLNTYLMAPMMGYFLYDTVTSVHTIRDYPADFVHHLLSMSFIGSAMTTMDDGLRLLPFVTFIEISTIPLNMMWFLRELGYDKTKFARYTGFSFVLLYFVIRLVLSPLFYVVAWWKKPHLRRRMPKIVWFVWTGLIVLGYYWGVAVFRQLGKQLERTPLS